MQKYAILFAKIFEMRQLQRIDSLCSEEQRGRLKQLEDEVDALLSEKVNEVKTND